MNDGISGALRPLNIMLVAGEPSGDRLGAQLMSALKTLAGDRIVITGVGGAAMAAEGLESLYPLDTTSVMGLREVVPRIPAILKRVKQAAGFALKTRPDIVVLIDSPDFTHRIARALKRAAPHIKVANYAPPQVWASRPYRAKAMARYIDAVLTLFPFEAKFFAESGIRSYAVGFPVIERGLHVKGGAAFRRRHAIAADAKLLAVLPGSRCNEIRFILPTFKAAVKILAREIPGLVCVLPTVSLVASLVKDAAADWPVPACVIEDDEDKFLAFDAADAALAASGTVTLELALSRTPMVVGYRAGWITYALAINFVRVRHMALVNLLLGREAVPEFLQGKCTPHALARALRPLLMESAQSARQIHDLDEVVRGLGEGKESPSLRAAEVVLELAAGRSILPKKC